MKRKICLPLALVILLVGCGGEEHREAPTSPPPPERSAQTVASVAEEQEQEQETLEAAQVESTARMPTEEEILEEYDRAVRIYSWVERL